MAQIVRDLLTGTWVDADGQERPITSDDILVVAPYNSHVNALADALPGLRVGTVDRFQGQEAAIVIYSMGTADVTEVPRGLPFLFSVNRFNVALSRAKALAIVVASPLLEYSPASTTADLRAINAFCRFVDLAERVELPDAVSAGSA